MSFLKKILLFFTILPFLCFSEEIIQLPGINEAQLKKWPLEEVQLQCSSWRVAVEANNLSPWKRIPEECADYVKEYMMGKGYEIDLERVSNDAGIYARSVDLIGDGKDLTVHEILDAPGEVIGKSSYGTLYRASLVNSNSLTLLRFLRPTCTLRIKEVVPIVELLGSIRHPNLAPLIAFYAGARGEKLMVHPFYGPGNLAQFVRGGNDEARKWPLICKISIGIARGLHHLHTALEKPIIHGNLKSKNIFLDFNYQPHISDYGLHLVLNPTAGQQMLEVSASQGYKPPELIKMKEASEVSDIYSLGVIFLELLTGKKPIDENPSPDQEFYLPNAMRNAVLDERITGLYHPDFLVGLSNDEKEKTEDEILRYFQLAMACCSPSRLLRPDIKQILDKLQEIGK